MQFLQDTFYKGEQSDRHKAGIYAEPGVREYWVVDPMEERIDIFTNTEKRFNLMAKVETKGETRSAIFPEFRVEAGKLFS